MPSDNRFNDQDDSSEDDRLHRTGSTTEARTTHLFLYPNAKFLIKLGVYLVGLPPDCLTGRMISLEIVSAITCYVTMLLSHT